MTVVSIITAITYMNATNEDNMRILLFVLLIVAIGLIISGAIIALVTLYSYRKTRSHNADRLPGE
ncbi:hypothetical protein [Dictyobacter formicarum]|uniref:Lipopolysaccharide assembly protein A domain-containing protein n=1 Tax=Dictyobacter formicarum TaxID=2778368 RepID=A0ABQ3VEE7_9CHLR|nr:hypothetical protein [Dictyobacter formicarum]GHO84193.1 hypothetical protein KSZ_21990 [Dictyobacter formicarum]